MNNKTVITIKKEEITPLPKELFEGKIVIVQNDTDAQNAIRILEQNKIVGFDTETKPSFKKGKSNQVSLIQLATDDICFLFRINIMGFTDTIKNFLNNSSVIKVGLSIHDDFSMLHKVGNFEPDQFVDLQKYVKRFNIQDISLQKVYAILFGKKISKSQRLSNWEAETLSERQLKSAATEAWAWIRIYKALSSGNYRFTVEPRIIEN